MRFFLPIVFVLLCFNTWAQESSVKTIDRNAIATGYFPLPVLAQKLCAPYKTDREKVRSIFRWITDHIAYDVVQYHHADPIPINDTLFGKAYDDWLSTYYAQKAINKKMGICNDYAHLFKALCKEANINCAIVNGIAKHIEFDEKETDQGHAWNAVKIDNKWQLIDATWCAGTTDLAVKKFHKEFTERYYLIAPAKMMLDHFPDSAKWQLTNTTYTKVAFQTKPYFYELPIELNIISVQPFKNTISKGLNDTVIIDFVFAKKTENIEVSLSDGTSIERNISIKGEKKKNLYSLLKVRLNSYKKVWMNCSII